MDNKKVNPINSKSPANNYYYNPYNQSNNQKPNNRSNSNFSGDYFEKSEEVPEYNYDSSGNFKETFNSKDISKETSDLKKTSRLRKNNSYDKNIDYKIVTKRAENDVHGFIPGPPPYMSKDSYSQYLMENPKNKYIKRLKGEEKAPDIVYEKDVINEYFDEDNFTLKDHR